MWLPPPPVSGGAGGVEVGVNGRVVVATLFEEEE